MARYRAAAVAKSLPAVPDAVATVTSDDAQTEEFPLESKSFTRNEHSFVSQVDGETVLFHAKTGAYFRIDGAGTDIWERLGNDPVSFQALLDGLIADYEVEPATAREEVRTFLRRLVRTRNVLVQ